MKIKAKFASTCPTCGEWMAPGTEVEWKRGYKAEHVACAGNREAVKAERAKKRAEAEARHAEIAKFEKAAYRIAHVKKGSCFANMHEVAEAMYEAGCGARNRIGEREPGWLAEAWKKYGPCAVLFVSMITLPSEPIVEAWKKSAA